MHRTPKKPAESRVQLVEMIVAEGVRLNWDPAQMCAHLFTFFTDVDLKLIHDGMKDIQNIRKET